MNVSSRVRQALSLERLRKLVQPGKWVLFLEILESSHNNNGYRGMIADDPYTVESGYHNLRIIPVNGEWLVASATIILPENLGRQPVTAMLDPTHGIQMATVPSNVVFQMWKGEGLGYFKVTAQGKIVPAEPPVAPTN